MNASYWPGAQSSRRITEHIPFANSYKIRNLQVCEDHTLLGGAANDYVASESCTVHNESCTYPSLDTTCTW